ncbi:MAG: hypothetical protein RI556_02845 [Hydrogenovibrio sp.]|uniref:hypothetical protein n=1 Tax=Hydrogenovibrio sp. TaxID=2065821 RepID=UPI0028701140|nr:hypothetical protein [Hydrogenovibrio sp.]MDR9498085.1 hypothetical protein [Hydrogenovibrio sp.]
MSDNADDLLDELEQLEHASDKMADDVQQAKDKREELKTAETVSELDAAALSLESSKTAQMAAEQSQKAAEAAVKMSHEQKAQLMELGDANVAWRQALRTASRDLKSSKNAVSIMMGVSVTVSLSAAGAIGWMLYHQNQQQEAFENEVADILTTETRLFQKDMTLKVDQLASLIESMSADIRRLAQNNAAEPVTDANRDSAPADSTETPNTQTAPEQETRAEEETLDQSSNSTETTEPNKPAKASPEAESVETTETTSAQPASNMEMDLTPLQDALASLDGQNDQQQQALTQIQEKLGRILTLQSQLEAKTLAELAKVNKAQSQSSAQASNNDSQNTEQSDASTASSLTDEQAERLKAIAWSAFQERKMLKNIEASLKELMQQLSASPSASAPDTTTGPALNKITHQLDALGQSVDALQTQQSQIEQKVEKLDALTQKLAAKPDPYRYSAPDRQSE